MSLQAGSTIRVWENELPLAEITVALLGPRISRIDISLHAVAYHGVNNRLDEEDPANWRSSSRDHISLKYNIYSVHRGHERARARIPGGLSALLSPFALCTQGSRDLIARCPISRAGGVLLSIVILSITHTHTHVYAPYLRDMELHRFYASVIKKFIPQARVTFRLKKE